MNSEPIVYNYEMWCIDASAHPLWQGKNWMFLFHILWVIKCTLHNLFPVGVSSLRGRFCSAYLDGIADLYGSLLFPQPPPGLRPIVPSTEPLAQRQIATDSKLKMVPDLGNKLIGLTGHVFLSVLLFCVCVWQSLYLPAFLFRSLSPLVLFFFLSLYLCVFLSICHHYSICSVFLSVSVSVFIFCLSVLSVSICGFFLFLIIFCLYMFNMCLSLCYLLCV